MNKPRIAKIYLKQEHGAWSWSFSKWHGSEYAVHSLVSNTIVSYAISVATRIAKKNGFDDAKVVDVSIVKRPTLNAQRSTLKDLEGETR